MSLKLTNKDRRTVQIDGYKLLHKNNDLVDDLKGQEANLNIQDCYLFKDIEYYLSNKTKSSSFKNCSENQDNNFLAFSNGYCYSISDTNVEPIKKNLSVLDDEKCGDNEVKFGSKIITYVSPVDKEE